MIEENAKTLAEKIRKDAPGIEVAVMCNDVYGEYCVDVTGRFRFPVKSLEQWEERKSLVVEV